MNSFVLPAKFVSNVIEIFEGSAARLDHRWSLIRVKEIVVFNLCKKKKIGTLLYLINDIRCKKKTNVS